jgi:hypothetical protein
MDFSSKKRTYDCGCLLRFLHKGKDLARWQETCCSVVVEALCCKPEGNGFETRWGNLFFSIDLIIPAAVGPGVHSASNKNEYQKRRKRFWGAERGRCERLKTLPPSVSQLSRQCGILNISQPYRPPRPVSMIAFILLLLHLIKFYLGDQIRKKGMSEACNHSTHDSVAWVR